MIFGPSLFLKPLSNLHNIYKDIFLSVESNLTKLTTVTCFSVNCEIYFIFFSANLIFKGSTLGHRLQIWIAWGVAFNHLPSESGGLNSKTGISWECSERIICDVKNIIFKSRLYVGHKTVRWRCFIILFNVTHCVGATILTAASGGVLVSCFRRIG